MECRLPAYLLYTEDENIRWFSITFARVSYVATSAEDPDRSNETTQPFVMRVHLTRRLIVLDDSGLDPGTPQVSGAL